LNKHFQNLDHSKASIYENPRNPLNPRSIPLPPTSEKIREIREICVPSQSLQNSRESTNPRESAKSAFHLTPCSHPLPTNPRESAKSAKSALHLKPCFLYLPTNPRESAKSAKSAFHHLPPKSAKSAFHHNPRSIPNPRSTHPYFLSNDTSSSPASYGR
jgi:hypothetical protein